MGYVPDDWHTAKFDHRVTSYKVGMFKKMLTCTCGCSGYNAHQLWQAHVVSEKQIAHAMAHIEDVRQQRWRILIDAEKAKGREQRISPNKVKIPTPKQKWGGYTTNRTMESMDSDNWPVPTDEDSDTIPF